MEDGIDRNGRSEQIAVTDADGVQAFVGFGHIAVGDMVEHHKEAVVLRQGITEFQGKVKQDPAAELFFVGGVGRGDIAVMQGQPRAKIEDEAISPKILPDSTGVDFAGIAAVIEGDTEIRSYAAMPECVGGVEDKFCVYIVAALPRKPAPQVFGIVIEETETNFMNPHSVSRRL